MNILDRYILRAILGTTAMVLSVLLGLAAFIEFFGQLDDIGEGSYGLPQAAAYVALRLPRLAVEMLPAAALLGSLLGLGNLAARSELIAMQAAGVSRLQMARAALMTGAVLVVFMGSVGEYFSPTLANYARQMRAIAKFDELTVGGLNAWVRDGSVIMNMRQDDTAPGNAGIFVFEIGPGQQLTALGRGDSATAEGAGAWLLSGYAETRFQDERVVAAEGVRLLGTEMLTEDLLNLSVVRPADLDARGLWMYVTYLRANQLDSTAYEVAFWSRLANIASVAVMTVLALPFVFGSLRAAGAGARLMVGVMIGLGYFLVSRMLANGAVVFDIPPVIVAWAPTGLLLALAIGGLARSR
ncbi:MAG: LPS export ABC transporter permease LptG [Gammaproteobacteria bacterium]|nr:LPS export ABC transporter permease LptG [Gammaproteobacteria bacterium]